MAGVALRNGAANWRAVRTEISRRVSCQYLLELAGVARRGARWACPHPCHHGQGDSPDLVLNLEKNTWRCYSCAAKGNEQSRGNVFGLAVHVGMASDWREAVSLLADFAGVEIPDLPKESKDHGPTVPDTTRREIRERFARFAARDEWFTKACGGARWLERERGIPFSVSRSAGAGWIADPKGLHEALKERWAPDKLQAAGLCSKRGFPLFKMNRLVLPASTGASGLALRKIGKPQKFKELSAGSPLWGMDMLDGAELVVVCEGPIDWLSALTCGVPAIGVPGTARWHMVIEKLDQLPAVPVVVIFDGDEAGRACAPKLVNALVNLGRHAVALDVPDGADLNDLLRAGALGSGGNQMMSMVKGALS